jgi:hypothetical protein
MHSPPDRGGEFLTLGGPGVTLSMSQADVKDFNLPLIYLFLVKNPYMFA